MNKNFVKEEKKQPLVETPLDKELDAALKDFHQRYGNDFNAFLKEVKESLRKQGKLQSESPKLFQF